MRKVCDALDKFFKLFYYFAGIILFAMLVVSASDVASRLAGHPLVWANEMVRFLMFYMSFVACVYLVSARKNLEVDLTAIFCPNKTKLLEKTHIIGDFVLLVVLVYLIFPTWQLTVQNTTVKSSAMQWPMSVVYVIMPISFALCVVAHLKNMVRDFLPKEESAEKKED